MNGQLALAEMIRLLTGLDETSSIFGVTLIRSCTTVSAKEWSPFNRSTASSARTISKSTPRAAVAGCEPTPDSPGGELFRVRCERRPPSPGEVADRSDRSWSGSFPHGALASLSSSDGNWLVGHLCARREQAGVGSPVCDESDRFLERKLSASGRSKLTSASTFGVRNSEFCTVSHQSAGANPCAPAGRSSGNKAAQCAATSFHVVTDLGHGADGRARRLTACAVRWRWRGECLHAVHLRLIHAVEKLAGVRRKGFDVTTLAFGEEGVERQRTLARTAQARDDDEFG